MSGLINETDAAKILGISVLTLRTWRSTGRTHIPYVRIGSKSIRYKVEDLHAFIAAQTVGGAE